MGLLDTVKQGGSLLSGSQQSLASLVSSANQAATPSTPVETGVIGANADQAKMAGTPAQQKAAAQRAVRADARGQVDLATAIQQSVAGGTAQQQQQWSGERQQADSLSGIGTMASRLPALIKRNIDQVAADAASITSRQVDTSKLPPDKVASATPDLTILASTTASPAEKQAATGRLITTLGLPDSTTPDTLLANYTDVGTQLASVASAAAAGKNVYSATVGSIMSPSDLGMTSWDQVAGALGTTASALAGMTVQQLGNLVNQTRSTGFTTEAQWRAALADPTSSPNVRQAARDALKASGAAGVSSAEAGVEKLATSVQNADTIDFYGHTMTVEDALKEDSFKGLVKDALTNPTTMAALTAGSPALAKWVTDNAAALKEATKTATTAVVEEGKAIAANANSSKSITASVGGSAGAMGLIAGLGGVTLKPDGTINNTVPLTGFARTYAGLAPTAQAALGGLFQHASSLGWTPQQMQSLGLQNMTPQQLQASGLLDPTSAAYHNLKSSMQGSAALAPGSGISHDAQVASAFGNPNAPDNDPTHSPSESQIVAQIDQLKQRARITGENISQWADLVTPDGHLDMNKVSALVGQPSIPPKTSLYDQLQGALKGAPGTDPVLGDVQKALYGITDPGKGADALERLANGKSPDEILHLADVAGAMYPGMNYDKRLKEVADRAVAKDVSGLASASGFNDIGDAISSAGFKSKWDDPAQASKMQGFMDSLSAKAADPRTPAPLRKAYGDAAAQMKKNKDWATSPASSRALSGGIGFSPASPGTLAIDTSGQPLSIAPVNPNAEPGNTQVIGNSTPTAGAGGVSVTGL